jgi:hypothetical protein
VKQDIEAVETELVKNGTGKPRRKRKAIDRTLMKVQKPFWDVGRHD